MFPLKLGCGKTASSSRYKAYVLNWISRAAKKGQNKPIQGHFSAISEGKYMNGLITGAIFEAIEKDSLKTASEKCNGSKSE